MKTPLLIGSSLLLAGSLCFSQLNSEAPSVVGDASSAAVSTEMNEATASEVAWRAAALRASARFARNLIRTQRFLSAEASDRDLTADQKVRLLDGDGA